jgi:hypothetical protein
MTTQSSHMVHTAPLSCLMTPIWYIQCNGIQHGATWLPCGSSSCPRAPSTSHVAPYGPHMGHIAPIWLTFGSQDAHLVHISQMALIQCMQLPYGACGSYVAYAAPIWRMQLPHGANGSHIASHVEHTTPMWPSHGTCSFHMVPCASHMVPSTSNMAHTAPTQHTQLPYGPHMSHSSPR